MGGVVLLVIQRSLLQRPLAIGALSALFRCYGLFAASSPVLALVSLEREGRLERACMHARRIEKSDGDLGQWLRVFSRV